MAGMNRHAERLRAIASDLKGQPGRADDLQLAAGEIERFERRIEELEGFVNGLAINCAIVARAAS